jgi:FkbM family methyltransferase
MLREVVQRVTRITLRFINSGQLSSSPVPIIARALDTKETFFVQVGSNDGKSGDPLHALIKRNAKWKGIFIEPVSSAFAKLIENYGRSKRFVFENIAISEEDGERLFYFVPETALADIAVPDKSDQMGSFDRNHITKHADVLDKYIVSKKVRCERLMTVLNRHKVSKIDLLHIDAEGYDYQVLRQFDFEAYKPTIILYEHCHLNEADLRASRLLLKTAGYHLINCGLDTLATDSSAWRTRFRSIADRIPMIADRIPMIADRIPMIADSGG